ncbi:MAG: hypothetical protein A4E66_01939 [Syntrophus sp. PtaB.Bin001]|nr:MAG: hypothetical protein A4E66_01939 [Syntrophus sp. PtaB.Bin001]
MIENSGVPESSEGGHSMINENTAKGHLPEINDKIYDLMEIVDEPHGRIYDLVDAIEESEPLPKEKPQEVLVIDGRAYKKEKQSDVKIHDLVDIVGEESTSGQPKIISEDEMKKTIVEVVEKMAREMIPDIVERIIREEIEKLKQETEEDIH